MVIKGILLNGICLSPLKGIQRFTNVWVTAFGATLPSGFLCFHTEDTIVYSAYFAPPICGKVIIKKGRFRDSYF